MMPTPTRHPIGHQRTVRLERLEDRLALSGFGPEDGSYFVESRSGEYGYGSVAIQPADQKIVATGKYGSQIAVARYDALGFADSTYGTGGLATPALSLCAGSAISLQPDGKAVVAGCVGGPATDAAVARLNTDGSPDTSFSGDGVAEFHINGSSPNMSSALSRQSSGKIIVTSGDFVARLTTSGALDSGENGFGSGSDGDNSGYVRAAFSGGSYFGSGVAVQQDDKIVTVGTVKSPSHLVVARYMADGTLDSTFADSGYSIFLPAGVTHGQAVALQADGKIVVCGDIFGPDGGDMLVARYNTDGTLDASFGGGNGYVRLDVDGTASRTAEYGNGVTIQPDGKIVAVGWETDGGAQNNALVARFNPDGSPDTSFGSGGYKLRLVPNTTLYGNSVAVQTDGSIIVAGQADSPPGSNDPHPFLMRFFGAGATSNSVSVLAEDGKQTITGFAQKLFPGFPPGGSPDARFIVTNDNNALFKDQPAIDFTGTLSFTPAPNSQGKATVTVVKKTAAEGEQGGDVDLDTATFTIEIIQRDPLQNDLDEYNVNNDLDVASDDILLVINYLNAWGSTEILPGTEPEAPFYDSTGNNWIAPEDALWIINYYNSLDETPNPEPPDPEPESGEGSRESGAGSRATAATPNTEISPVGLTDDALYALLAAEVAAQPRRRV